MKCPKCNGRGTVGYFHIDHFADIECDRCHGSGEVSETDVTNEEWFCGLSTEEKAKVIVNIHNLANIEQIEWWLKEIHQ